MLFFFQAEDGIRDYKVTGVQTCALPILAGDLVAGRLIGPLVGPASWVAEAGGRVVGAVVVTDKPAMGHTAARAWVADVRSEERRVGKERRTGGSREQYKNKDIRKKRGTL